MRRIRVIPVLLFSQNGMVKTKAFSKPRYLGDPINAVKIFNEKQADELVLLDIEAGPKGFINLSWIEDIVSEAFMPIAYGGGVTTVEQAAETAARAGVGTLVLTHYVPAIQPGQEDEWRARAAAHFSGTIVLGDDLTAVDL